MTPEQMRKLAALGLSTDQIAGVMEIMNEEAETRRSQGRDRWHKWNDKRKQTLANASKQQLTTANDSREGVTRGLDNLQTKYQDGKEERKKEEAPAAQTPRSHLSAVLDDERAQAVIDHRQRLKKPLTAHAAKLLAAKFSLWPDANAAADLMIEKGWQSFEPSWAENAATPQRQAVGPPPRRNLTAVEANIARRIRRNEPASGRCDHVDAELLPPDKPELRGLIGNLGASMLVPDGSGHH